MLIDSYQKRKFDITARLEKQTNSILRVKRIDFEQNPEEDRGSKVGIRRRGKVPKNKIFMRPKSEREVNGEINGAWRGRGMGAARVGDYGGCGIPRTRKKEKDEKCQPKMPQSECRFHTKGVESGRFVIFYYVCLQE